MTAAALTPAPSRRPPAPDAEAGSPLLPDPLVEQAVGDGGRLTAGGWELRLPRAFGLCGGVRNALHLLQQAMHDRPGQPFWLLGEIIHNETVNHWFQARGVRILADADLAAAIRTAAHNDAILVVPAFGLPADLDRALRQACPPERIVDTTCGYVHRIWTFVEAMATEGRTVVLHAKPAHPETRATLSRALRPGTGAVVVPDEPAAQRLAAAIRAGDPAALPAALVHGSTPLPLRHLAIANQTTMLARETEAITRLLAGAVREVGGDLVPANTICRATEDRQQAAVDLCRDGCDRILVVGSFLSSNTTQLYRLAVGHAPTYFVQTAAEIGRDRIRHYRPETDRVDETADWLPARARIGLLAGASCPPSDIGGVFRRFVRMAADGTAGPRPTHGPPNPGPDSPAPDWNRQP